MSSPVPVIAIDGPTASGKGTIASRVATRLGFHYLESGSLYRLVALAGGEPVQAARGLDVAYRGGRIFLKEQDVTDELRAEAVGNRASEIASDQRVRSVLLERQRAFRRAPGLVADGRDMGTVVFPDASLKIYLTASPGVRAQRRYKQLIDKGNSANLASLSRELEERDRRDATRAVAPLKPAADAVQVDSSALSIDQVVDLIVKQFRERTVGKA
ncbi:MAG TPA: (d)CMP kinase [Burkholderiales bacterium]|jgi:cytidylate kinase|nr:(d)CMP kinase [Burkholderiales bacterium]